VLAIHPVTTGIVFAHFSGPLSPRDWGIKEARGRSKNALALEAAVCLIEHLQPDVLVLEDCSGPLSRRGHRMRRLQRLIANSATGQAVDVHWFSRADIRKCFAGVGAVTRQEIARAIASQIHAFSHRVPPARRAWDRENPRLGLFDAASLAMTFYSRAAPPES
jgi:hypothetical protein